MIDVDLPGVDVLDARAQLQPGRNGQIVEDLHAPLVFEQVTEDGVVLEVVGLEERVEADAVAVERPCRDHAAALDASAHEDVEEVPVLGSVVEAQEGSDAFRLQDEWGRVDLLGTRLFRGIDVLVGAEADDPIAVLLRDVELFNDVEDE